MRSLGTISRYSPWNPTSKPPSATITYRHLPPTRRSISASVTSPRLACHQRLTSSGAVNALYTRCFGASNSRSMRICSSVGSVTFALPLLVTGISLLLLFEVFQHDVELHEPLRPRVLVRLHPVVDGLERATVEPVHALPSFLSHLDHSHLPEHPQVLGHLRLCQPELADKVVDGTFAAGQGVDDLPPSRLGDRVERIGCRCGSR